MKTALYITLDGLSDQLGGSQILPYVKYLARHGHKLTILSCEKRKNLTDEIRDQIKADLAAAGIEWDYVFYTPKPPILSGLYDRWQLKRRARHLHQRTPFDLVHCRSYIPAMVGLDLKRWGQSASGKAPKFIFDMRGFWADEKVEVGSWPQTKPHFRLVYSYFKRAERDLIAGSDHIVILTDAGRVELMSWPEYRDLTNPPPITVIPCCVDTDHFEIRTQKEKRQIKDHLGLGADTPVLGYLGAIGGWYMIEEMLAYFAALKSSNPAAKMFFVTRSDPNLILGRLSDQGLTDDDVLIRPAQRHEVPELLGAIDLGLSFIKPTYAKTASSPTKQAEYLACGVPIVTNDRIGDNLALIEPIPGCHVIPDLEEETLRRFADQTDLTNETLSEEALDARAVHIRQASILKFSLSYGAQRYIDVYDGL